MTAGPPTSASPPGGDAGGVTERPHTGWTDVRPRAWNLLLLVPLVSCVPPLFNSAEPRLAGVPFFYWFQLLVIPLGILCTVTVHLMTRGADEEDSAAGAIAGSAAWSVPEPAATEDPEARR